nr:MAG TPA: hypothetical protein [Caudoviricetes sp.]
MKFYFLLTNNMLLLTNKLTLSYFLIYLGVHVFI